MDDTFKKTRELLKQGVDTINTDRVTSQLERNELLEDYRLALAELGRAERNLAEGYRKGERRARHIIGLLDSNDRKDAAVKRLERKLIAIYKIRKDRFDLVGQIVEEAIPRALAAYKERNAGS